MLVITRLLVSMTQFVECFPQEAILGADGEVVSYLRSLSSLAMTQLRVCKTQVHFESCLKECEPIAPCLSKKVFFLFHCESCVPCFTALMPFLVGLVHVAAWSIFVVAALRWRKIRGKEWETRGTYWLKSGNTALSVSFLETVLCGWLFLVQAKAVGCAGSSLDMG